MRLIRNLQVLDAHLQEFFGLRVNYTDGDAVANVELELENFVF